MFTTLTRKLTVAALVLLVLGISTSSFTIINLLTIRSAVEYLSNNTMYQVKLSGDFNLDMFRGISEAMFYARSGDPDKRASAVQEMADSGEILNEITTLNQQPSAYAPEIQTEQIALQERRAALYDKIRPSVEKVLQAVDTNNSEALNTALDGLTTNGTAIEAFEEESGDLAERTIVAADQAITARFQDALISTAVLFGLFLVIMVSASMALRRWIVQPIKSLAAATEIVGDGRLDYAVKVTSNDEIGHLQRTFNAMLANIRAQQDMLNQRTEELAAANAKAEQAREAAENASQLKSQFLANMSHELRTPLNSIINFTRIISTGMRGPVNADQIDYLNRVRLSGEHLLGLINDILDLSKIEAGRLDLYIEPIQVKELVSGVMSTAMGLIKDKPIELIHEIEDYLPPIEGDRTRLRQILLNLLSNAAKFTEQGTILVKVASKADHLVIQVTDSGIGINAEHLDTVFEEFRQVEGEVNRRYEGTGLGLAICRKLVEMHGGKIWVESTPGVGSTFAFSLPIQHAPEPITLATLSAHSHKTGVAVLVIDDDQAAIEIVASYLGKDGYAVYGITDSRHAIDQARQIQPSAIILDVLMPHKDGWEVLSELKSDTELRTIPVILFSILEEQRLGFYMGASAYLTKPIVAEELLHTVGQLVSNDATILLIDDDQNAREIITQQLSEKGTYNIATANCGRDGLEFIASTPPQLIILDLMMPEIDGFSVLNQLDEQDETRAIPVIVLTAKDLTRQEHDYLTQRVHGLLLKGHTSSDQLLGKVHSLLGTVAPHAASIIPGKD